MYSLGRPGRLTAGFGRSTTSEDAELSSSLKMARNRSRELIRDAAYAKRAKVIVQNNVVGWGIGMQAKVLTSRDELNETINDEIEDQWEDWMKARNCHTGQVLHFNDLERMAIGEVFEAGEVLIRLHAKRVGESRVPLALEVIEPERIADESIPRPTIAGNTIKLGVEVNQFGAPQAYWIRTLHPGDLRFSVTTIDEVERVPADDIMHLRVIDRWPQTRAMPWMHASGRKFQDMDGLTEAEITAARGAACYMGFIESPGGDAEFGAKQEDGTSQVELEPAIIEKLKAGEKFNFAAPNRPNTHLDPFMRMMLREVAAGTGVSYESLSRDYSQSNYSSSRLALLDDRDLWRVLQMWFIRAFRQRLHAVWLQRAVYAQAVTKISLAQYAANPTKFEAVRMKPRGWTWIDPTKEVEAYEKAIRNGFTTVSAVIGQTADGRDLEDILKERRQELDAMKAAGLMFDTDPATVETAAMKNPKPVAPAAPKDSADQAEEDQAGADDPAVKTAEGFIQNHVQGGRAHG
jgi:lambda family phage portal protein